MEMDLRLKIIVILYIFVELFLNFCGAKYVEGHLKTVDDWAFITRFCFLSGHGKYEYEIEFDRKYGEPQLLLYFDDKTQWPAVYKSEKTCQQKISVLSLKDNQIVPLSIRSPLNLFSGCQIVPKYAHGIAEEEQEEEEEEEDSDEVNSNTQEPFHYYGSDQMTVPGPSYYDQFLKTTVSTIDKPHENSTNLKTDYELINVSGNLTISNETDVFNSSNFSNELPIKHDVVLENKLENSSSYKLDVEELFVTTPNNAFDSLQQSTPIRRSRPAPVTSRRRSSKETLIVKCHNAGTFFSSRERWWYIAIANCGSEKGLDITYRFRMTNGPTGDFWHEHFSADEMLIPPILLIESMSYSFLIVALFFCTIELKSLHLYHCTYRLFGFSVILQWFGILLQGITWIKYGMTGLGPNPTAGGLFMGASEITYLLLLLLMAKGYTITRARLSSCSIVKLTIFINIYIVAYITLFVYQAEAFDPGEVLNIYESPAGFGLSILRCVAWCAFMVSTATTIRKNPEKASFYYPFGLLGSLWILGGPFLTLVGISVLDAWVRESVMCGTFAIMSFGGHSAFLWLTWPSRANKSFPYHVRTNHVGIASEEDDGADYPRHTYEPTVVDQNIIIPLSKRTEELISGIYGRYIYEQQMYPNTNLHGAYPVNTFMPPSAPPYPRSDVTGKAISENFKPHLDHKDNTNLSTELELDNQADSGHPSLDQSGTPSNTTVELSSNTASPAKESSRKDSATSLKNNPFTVNGVKRPPNKIILEPIEKPLRDNKLDASVPKHLFAVKKLSQ